MNLRNYTSTVQATRSVMGIEDLLAKFGASHTARFYGDDRRIAGVMFQLVVEGRPISFKLPANPKAVEKVMKAEVRKPRRGTMQKIEEQAERTAWKLLHDWVHAQLSLVKMEQAEAVQVFLPYVHDARTDQTLFEKVKEQGFRQLTEGAKKEK